MWVKCKLLMQMMQFPSGCYRQLVLCLLQASCYTSKLFTFTLLCKRLFSDVLINVDVGNTSKTISRSENHLKDILAKENDPALLQMTASVIGNLALRLVNSASSRLFSELILSLLSFWQVLVQSGWWQRHQTASSVSKSQILPKIQVNVEHERSFAPRCFLLRICDDKIVMNLTVLHMKN